MYRLAYSIVSEAMKRATIDKEWQAYIGTYLVPEEVLLIDKLKPLMAAADATLPGLHQRIAANDRSGVASFRATEMYPVFDPMQGATELPAVRRIVRRHGGRMWVESARGQGATFHFSLPATREITHA